jgi:hypothetical protein
MTGRRDARRRQADDDWTTLDDGRRWTVDGTTTTTMDVVARDDGRGTTTHVRVGLIYTPPKSHTRT